MAYKATQEVVRRVMPLLDLLAARSVDKARLLQYLSARSGVDWGAYDLLHEEQDDAAEVGATDQTFVFRDRSTGSEHRIRYPECLPAEIEPLVRAEYKRLASGRLLTSMSKDLFDYFYASTHCAACSWR